MHPTEIFDDAVKVLYTFDDQNKTNCLARWPQPLDIRTVNLDESTQIGVIELKTCIQAIVSASPELVAKLGQDYTVYAYDYSEYETPLVGQGMLSWVLASSSSTPPAPAHLSRALVTGRVCKSIMGLFSSSSQETLEVKLRLVPVPTCLQSEYLESIKKYRDLSKIIPLSFDPGTWISFLQANPAIGQLASQSRCQSPAAMPGRNNETGLEHMQRMLGEGRSSSYIGEQRSQPQSGNFQIIEANEQLARASSPATSVQSAVAPPKRRGRPPRNASRTSTRGRDTQPKNLLSRDAQDSIPSANDDRFDEGPNKKRAKVSKADWNGTVGLGMKPESLRVAASTAASVRIHQPTALRPPAIGNNALEGPPRAPTPVADPTKHMRRPPLPTARSNLRRESFTADDLSYESPYPTSDALPKPPDSAITSPENSRAGSSSHTPVDIASSPPIYRGASTAPSSPSLPTLPQNVDSGFMSGPIDDLFEDDELRPLDKEDLEVVSQYCRRTELPVAVQEQHTTHQIAPVDPAPQSQDHPDEKAIARSRTAARSASGFRGLDRTISSGNLAVPSPANNESTQRPTLNRSQTWSGHQPQLPVSDTAPLPQVSGSSENLGSRSRAGNGANAKRKKAIQSKLELSVAAGEIPPFCENCGAIETPTWRKAWVKVHSGTPEHVEISDEEGGIVAWQALKTDNEGNIYLYRIIKRTVLPNDEGFTEILLCNRKWLYVIGNKETNNNTACGLWLTNRKCMRPKEMWEKNQRDPDEKRKRAPRPKKTKTTTTSGQASNNPLDETNSGPNSLPASKDTGPGGNVDEVVTLPQINRQRASSEQAHSNNTEDFSAESALQRAIQSSPARFIGTQHVPIDVEDLTPKPTRRVLFPSLEQTGDQKPSSGNGSNCGNERPQVSPKPIGSASPDDDSQADKENRPPPPDEDESLDHLFEDFHGGAARPTTPTPSSKLIPEHFQTPRKPATPERNLPRTDDFFSSAAKAFLLPTTPKRTPSKASSQPLSDMTPFTAHLNQLLSESNNISPLADDFNFPSLPSLRNTPGGRIRDDFEFPPFDTRVLSTDAPMPSSPPAWFGVYEDPVEQGSVLWSDCPFPGSPGGDENGPATTGH